MEHDISIYSCYHFVLEKNYIENIRESLETLISNKKQIEFGYNKFSSLSKECLDCTALSLCYGECLKNCIINNNNNK